MPQTDKPPANTPPRPNLLLIEEYDALAVAIGSALRKFAPGHDRVVVPSLREGESAATDCRPELIVIDLDPPPDGLIPFFERLRAAHPAARLLAIGCGTSSEFAEARQGRGGIHFIEKPFELADFGRAVSELLPDAENAASGGARGSLADVDLVDLIALECVAGRNVILRVEAAAGRIGELHFADGHLCHAVAPGLLDTAAVEEMVRWPRPTFAEEERPRTAPRTLNVPWPALLVDVIRKTKTAEHALPASKPKARRRKVEAERARTVIVIDDTELLLEFVEDILAAADPELHIVTAHTGTEGVRRAELMVPDLVLLDYSLPDFNGDEVCRRLLANETTAQIPVVMMSGHVAEMAATAAQFSNVVSTIAKPFMSEQLVNLVTSSLAAAIRRRSEAPKPVPAVAPELPTAMPQNGAKNGHANGSSRNGGKQMPPPPPAVAESQPAEPPTPQPPPIAEKPAPTPPPVEAVEPVVVAAAELATAEEVKPAPAIEPTPPPAPKFVPQQAPLPVAQVAVAPAPPRLQAAPTLASPAPSAPLRPAVSVPNPTTVLLGLALELVGVQLTPTLRVGRMRARIASPTVSLNFPPETFHASVSMETGFDVEALTVNARHQMELIRLVPNRRPMESVQTTRRVAVEDVEVDVAKDSVRVTPEPSAMMSLRMHCAFKVVGVELTPTFEVARLVLTSVSQRVRLSIDPIGTIFQIAEARTDVPYHIAELVLVPI